MNLEENNVDEAIKSGPSITYNGKALETIVTGKKDASSGIILSAFVPEVGGRVLHRRFGSGKQGFHFGDGGEIPVNHKNSLGLIF